MKVSTRWRGPEGKSSRTYARRGLCVVRNSSLLRKKKNRRRLKSRSSSLANPPPPYQHPHKTPILRYIRKSRGPRAGGGRFISKLAREGRSLSLSLPFHQPPPSPVDLPSTKAKLPSFWGLGETLPKRAHATRKFFNTLVPRMTPSTLVTGGTDQEGFSAQLVPFHVDVATPPNLSASSSPPFQTSRPSSTQPIARTAPGKRGPVPTSCEACRRQRAKCIRSKGGQVGAEACTRCVKKGSFATLGGSISIVPRLLPD